MKARVQEKKSWRGNKRWMLQGNIRFSQRTGIKRMKNVGSRCWKAGILYKKQHMMAKIDAEEIR